MNTEISEASLIELETYADKLYDHNGNHIDVVTELAANDGKRIDWKYWLRLPYWKPREAVFLLNLYDPKKTPAHPDRKVDLDKITVLAKREQREGILPPKVSPTAWVEWAEEKGIRVPTQFAGLGAWTEAASAPEEKPKIEAATDTATPCDDWKNKAIVIANKLALERYERGEREITSRNICGAVQLELAKDSTTHGNRGERSADGIRNAALKGWKFIPTTGTNGTSGTKK